MTVRWKPLLILSGLFLVIAVVSVIAFAYALVPRNSADILPAARAARSGKQYANAQIHFKRALQKEPRNAAIHEELAGLYGEWAEQEKDDKAEELRRERIRELDSAAAYGQKLQEPRRILLADAMSRDDTGASIKWAKELVALDPKNLESHYVLANDALETRPPNLTAAKRHIEALQTGGAPKIRLDWVKARAADLTRNAATRDEILARCRTITLPAGADPADRMALLRLRVLDLVRGEDTGSTNASNGSPNLKTDLASTDPIVLGERIKALQDEVTAVVSTRPLPPARIIRLGELMGRVQKSLLQLTASTEADPKAKGALEALVTSIEATVDSLYLKTLDESNKPELALFLTYADHLRYREKRKECLEIVTRALRTPMASQPNALDTVMGLHAIATEAALSNLDDPERIDKASVHIKTLLASSNTRHQGLGHLFQGAIDLERAGVGAGNSQRKPAGVTVAVEEQAKLRTSALNHLKNAAVQLPLIAEAHARYGVALVLSQEQALGRQYLQKAMRMGTLAPQYQIWAAWSMVQAGYPEEADPIVRQLLAEVAAGKQPRDIEGTLHLLLAEIYQARRTPADLRKALEEYILANQHGQKASPAVQLRLAQIDVQLGNPDRALTRIDQLRKVDQGLPPVEHLAVLILQEQGRNEDARKTLDAARRKYPDNEELVAVDAAFLAKEGKPKEAEQTLAAFLKAHPSEVGVALMRAQVLSDMLNDVKTARKVLSDTAELSVNSAPLVQLALLELKEKDRDAAVRTIAKIRARWKEAATADLLDAQVALDDGDLSAAVTNLNEALKKDPGNKLVILQKAQLDLRTGAAPQGTDALESLASQRSSKQLDSGLTLMEAAQSALANIEIQNGDFSLAIQRLEELRAKSADGTLDRTGHWQLATALAAKGEWTKAKPEVLSLLNDAKNPPTADERVRAANFFRLFSEEDVAIQQLDLVLKQNSTHPGAVVVRAFMLANAKKASEAQSLLLKAIKATTNKDKTPPAFFLMLAAVENSLPPAETAGQRAIAALDQGLGVLPESMELVQAKYGVLTISQGSKASLEFVEAKAKGSSKKGFRRMLVEVYREQQNYAAAEAVVRELIRDNPKDSTLAANMIQLVALQAVKASDRNDRERVDTLNEMTSSLIKDFRSKFPNDMAFLQADCDLASRRGDLARAIQVTQEMDKLAKSSPNGPLNRARIYSVQSRIRESADAFEEALRRNDRQLDVRLLLGQTRLRLGETDEAIQQARIVLKGDNDRPEALLLEARALSESKGSPERRAANREEATQLLQKAVAKQKKFSAGYQFLAELQQSDRRTADAVATLEKGLKEVPDDAATLTQLVVYLAGPRADGTAASPADLDKANAVAEAALKRDNQGILALAIGVGYHKAGQLPLALKWAEKAAAVRDVPVVHLNFGDILLSLAESSREPGVAKAYFQQAVEQYDLVLKAQANSIEAVNNKAWILHTHLHETDKALELALGLMMRVDPSILPPEFFDTLGAIQQDKGKTRDAEDTYAKGLDKVADHPVLNYRMAKLLSSDRGRAQKANDYLKKALAGRDRLSPSMASELDSLVRHSIKGN